ncbi:hypothetical protein ACBP93_06565 [Paenalcaligenes hominis]|uniref:hypothetical protein n=1 Tax=Paenalcaligenes hominis TaxID=643674 RepID=UPI0035240EFD
MKLSEVMKTAVEPALSLLPERMRSKEASVMLLAIGLQESRFVHTYQIVQGRPGVKGPARGWWQFERMGGVHGVLTHAASKDHAFAVCRARGVQQNARAVWEHLEHDQVLAAAFARLLLWTDPRSLPRLGDEQGAWDLYMRVWRPGKPHLRTWAACYADALKEV